MTDGCIAKKNKQTRLRFELQEKILGHVCRTRDAGYDSLVNDNSIHRDRTTIIQALRPLINKGYITRSEERIEERNIEVVFRPTNKGVFYSLAFLGLKLDTILRANGDEDDITKYARLLGELVDVKERANFMANAARAVLDFDLFNKEGELQVSSKQELFTIGLVSALTGIARSKSPDTAVYFNNLPQLTKILTEKELEEVRTFYSKTATILNKALKNLPKEL
jgi:hypothetical protein